MSIIPLDQLFKVSDVIDRAFYNIPLMKYVVRKRKTLGSSETLDFEEHFKGFSKERVPQLVEAGGIILQSKEFAAIAIWFPPGKFPPRGNSSEYYDNSAVTKEKSKGIIGTEYWYLNSLARDPIRNDGVQGAVSEVVRPILKLAKDKNVGVVLEAISDHARDVYIHYGFKIVNQFELGNDSEMYSVYLMLYTG